MTQLQESLADYLYLDASHTTGYFGPVTERAVRKFQCDHNIVCSGTTANGYGVWGPQTQAEFARVDRNPINPARLSDGPMTAPATGEFEVTGWLPYWKTASSTEDVLPHLDKLTSILPFGYTMKTNGAIADTAELTKEPWTSLFKKAREKNVWVVPSVMWGSGDTTHIVLRNTNKRVALEDEIAQTVKALGFDGIDIDFEAKRHETINYFSTFLKGLYQRMGNKWVYCTVESRMPLENRYPLGLFVPPDATDRANDYVEMNKYCDRVEIMAYDQGRVDKKLNAVRKEPYAPVADPEWVESLVRLASQTIERDKIVLGIPTYGYEYEVTERSGGTYDYRRLWALNLSYGLEVAEKLNIKPERTSAGEIGFTYDPDELEKIDEGEKKTPRRTRGAWEAMGDEQFNFITWSDAEAVEDKVELAKELGLRGVALFKFDGGEDQEIWKVLDGLKGKAY